MKEGKKMHIFFGFKNGKLVTIIQSVEDEVENAIDMDYYIADPQDSEKQIVEWKQQAEKKKE